MGQKTQNLNLLLKVTTLFVNLKKKKKKIIWGYDPYELILNSIYLSINSSDISDIVVYNNPYVNLIRKVWSGERKKDKLNLIRKEKCEKENLVGFNLQPDLFSSLV